MHVVLVLQLRRTEPSGESIGFHLDFHRRTMQIPLCDEDSYDGGKLVFATPAGLKFPPRAAGSVTIHDKSIAHGVTAHLRGVRYGLFFLDF